MPKDPQKDAELLADLKTQFVRTLSFFLPRSRRPSRVLIYSLTLACLTRLPHPQSDSYLQADCLLHSTLFPRTHLLKAGKTREP